ncbi:MAG: MMPL family transporter [Frankiaceae bacterium]
MSMLDRLASLTLRNPRRILLLTLLVVVIAGALSAGIGNRLTMGGYESSRTESHRAAVALQDRFGQGEPNIVLLVSDPRGVDAPAVAALGAGLTRRLAGEPGVTDVVSYWSEKRPPGLRGRSGTEALVVGRITGGFDTTIERAADLSRRYAGRAGGASVSVGGSALMWRESTQQAAKDATRADSTVLPVVLVALVVVFGSVVAAMVPLGVAVVTMIVALALLRVLSLLVSASTFVTDVTTFLGLGLAIDYSLLLITRYREELAGGAATPKAIRAMLRTTGRTVILSAVTVAVSFLCMLVLPFTMFASLAAGGAVTALLAAATSVVVIPAALAWLGPRIDGWRIVRRRPRSSRVEDGRWHRLALVVMRRPATVIAGSLALLVLLALPVGGMKLRLPDEQVLPVSASSARVAQAVRAGFPADEQQAVQVVAPDAGDVSDHRPEIDAYARRLSALQGVARVDALTGSYADGRRIAQPARASGGRAVPGATYLSVVPAVDGYSAAGARLVRAVRSAPAPFGVIVGGSPAVSADTFDLLRHRLLLAAGLLVAAMLFLLFLLTGSVLLPVKAILLSALSLSATFGVLVLVFQDGHLRWLVGDFVVTGALTWTVPVLVVSVAFGLSMDYQVFMLARIKEEHDRTGDDVTAVAVGLERIGRVVTCAALLLSIVLLVLVTSGVSYMKAIGLGLPLAILLDATVVRGALLPALMRVLGAANWWAPAPLRRLHARLHPRVHGHQRSDAAAPAGAVQEKAGARVAQ